MSLLGMTNNPKNLTVEKLKEQRIWNAAIDAATRAVVEKGSSSDIVIAISELRK